VLIFYTKELKPEHILELARRAGLLKRLEEFNTADYLLTSLIYDISKGKEYKLVFSNSSLIFCYKFD